MDESLKDTVKKPKRPERQETSLFNRIRAWLDKNAATKTAWITAFVTIVALGLNSWIIWQNSKSIKASQEMAKLMKQSNDINFRPYVQIEGLPPEQIVSLAINNVNDSNVIDKIKSTTFIIWIDPKTEKEYLIYNLKNLGHVPAHIIKQCVSVDEIDSNEKAENLPIEQETITTSETLFAAQTSTARRLIGKGVLIRQDLASKFIRVKLKINYSGVRNDPNIYYYLMTLRLTPANDVANYNSGGGFNIKLEMSDEGIEQLNGKELILDESCNN